MGVSCISSSPSSGLFVANKSTLLPIGKTVNNKHKVSFYSDFPFKITLTITQGVPPPALPPCQYPYLTSFLQQSQYFFNGSALSLKFTCLLVYKMLNKIKEFIFTHHHHPVHLLSGICACAKHGQRSYDHFQGPSCLAQ